MSARRRQPRPRRAARGLSLVELLVATTLGLIIIAAITALFANISNTNREMARTGSQIENARFALQFLREDIVHAGFWGRYVPLYEDIMAVNSAPPYVDLPTVVPDPCLPWGPWPVSERAARIGIPVQVHDAVPGTCAGVINDHLSGTDILTVRHAETCREGDANCPALAADELIFAASTCAEQIEGIGPFAGDGPRPYVLDPNAATPALRMDCATPVLRRRYVQSIYYVRDYSVDPGDGIPTLMRSSFGLFGGVPRPVASQALVPGIENLQVELGFDTVSETGDAVDFASGPRWQPIGDPPAAIRDTLFNRGDGVPDVQASGDLFVNCTGASPCTLEQLRNTVLVRIYVLARASERSPGYVDEKSYQLGSVMVPASNDGFKRHAFSNTIRLNNVAGRRETP